MTAEHEEICTQSLHIDRCVSNTLCAINQHRNIVRMGNLDDALHIVDRAEGVIDMTH